MTRAGVTVCLALSTALLASACGGRKADPVSLKRATDGQLTCAHLSAERSVNEARVKDLLGEAEAANLNNFGLLLVSPLFLDLSNVEQEEVRALNARNEELARLQAAKGCQS
jgi:hypothetical protein